MFTSDEIELLLEALESWENETGHRAAFSGLLGMMAATSQEDGKRAMETEMDEAAHESKCRKRRAILLKAKLVQMQDEIVGEELFSDVKIVVKE